MEFLDLILQERLLKEMIEMNEITKKEKKLSSSFETYTYHSLEEKERVLWKEQQKCVVSYARLI